MRSLVKVEKKQIMKTADKWSSIEVLRENPKEFCVYTKPAVFSSLVCIFFFINGIKISKTKTFFYVKFAATQTKANIFAKNNFHQTL